MTEQERLAKEKQLKALENLKFTVKAMLDLELKFSKQPEIIDELLDQINQINQDIETLKKELNQ